MEITTEDDLDLGYDLVEVADHRARGGRREKVTINDLALVMAIRERSPHS